MAKIIASGKCGANLTWTLDDAGLLTISGTGAMTDWNKDAPPWYSLRGSIKAVVIDDGVTSIGDDAFYWCSALERVTIGASVRSIGVGAFEECTALESVTIPLKFLPEGVTSIGGRQAYFKRGGDKQ